MAITKNAALKYLNVVYFSDPKAMSIYYKVYNSDDI